MVTKQQIIDRLAEIMRTDLKLGDVQITPDMPLAGGDFDLDSLDLLLLVTNVEKTYGIKIPNSAVGKEVFVNIDTLASFILSHMESAQQSETAASD